MTMTTLIKNRIPAITAATLALAFLATGCATKGFVRSEVATSRDEMAVETRDLIERTGELETQLAELRNSTAEASARAGIAYDLAEEARAQALGGLGYREVHRYEIHFAFDSSQLSDDALQTLQTAAQTIESEPGSLVDIYGFADATGPSEYNKMLGQWRAEQVMDLLKGLTPPPMNRYAAVSYGEKQSMTGDTTPEQRAKDRRVVISLIERVPEHESISQLDTEAKN